jgi:hypothetical protein
MSDEKKNGNGPGLQYPFTPPEYWMITEETIRVVETGSALDNSLRQAPMRIKRTRAIQTHPLAHQMVALANGDEHYSIIYAVPITKKLFDWWVSMFEPVAATKVNEIADKVDAENAG